jgi:hypothetical protein
MPRPKRIMSCDAETDPFLHGRIPFPFIWGLYDGRDFDTFDNTASFVERVRDLDIILFAHNGGKFDFMYLLPFIKETKAQIINGRIVSMYLGACELRDSFSIIPEPLKNFGDKREIDYAKLEKSVRHLHMPEITEYLFYDCKILYDACNAYAEQAGRKKTIASNALAYSKKLGIDPGKTNARFDAKYRKFYYGGRTECFQAGTHRNIKILDIHSAYPFAMVHDHATGSEFERGANIEELTDDEISRSFITIECMSHGAFPKRVIGPEGGLSFPHEYDEYNITGWEYLVAREFGLFDNAKIHSIRYTKDKINFREYVEHWYARKSSIKKKDDPINYTIAKIMMNSLYGKLAQNITKYYDYKIMPGGTPICPFEADRDPIKCKLCGEKDSEHGWQISTEFAGHEIHRRSSLFKYKLKFGAEWEARSLYNNVATGASITGFTRAHLLRAMCIIGRSNVIYCDTDSIISKAGTDVTGLAQSPALGDWEVEDACAPIGHFAGKKMYGIQLSSTDKYGKPEFKIASKGSKLFFDQMLELVEGKTVQWKSPAPSFSLTSGNVPDLSRHNIPENDLANDKMFVVRNIRRTAKTPSN